MSKENPLVSQETPAVKEESFQKEIVKNFYQQISGVLGLPPVRSSEKESISSEEEIISSACAISNIIEPEEKKEGN